MWAALPARRTGSGPDTISTIRAAAGRLAAVSPGSRDGAVAPRITRGDPAGRTGWPECAATAPQAVRGEAMLGRNAASFLLRLFFVAPRLGIKLESLSHPLPGQSERHSLLLHRDKLCIGDRHTAYPI